MRRPRLLVLSQTLPFPPDGGVKIRTYNVLRQLAREFDITALCFFRWKNGALQTDVPRAIEGLGGFGRVQAFPIPQEHSVARLVWDHARSTLARKAYTVFTYESRSYVARLREVLQEEAFDLAHVDSLDLSCHLENLGSLPYACVHHDVQSILLDRRAAQQRSLARRAYIAWQARLMEQEERYWLSRAPLNVAVSEVDRDRFRAMVPQARITVVPNGVDVGFFQPRPGPEDGVAFVGGSTWFPNLDGMLWFGESIMPELRRLHPEPTVRWIGRTTPGEARRFRTEFGIDALGYVDDIRDHVGGAACVIVPLRVGGGTRIKILDAWAMGKAIVSTSVGCEGLDSRDGENILIRDEPVAFAKAINQVLQDQALRRRLGEAGRATVEARYGWDAIGREMNRTYLSLVRP